MLLNLHSQELRGSYKGSSCVQDVFLKERLMARAKRFDALTQTLSLSQCKFNQNLFNSKVDWSANTLSVEGDGKSRC